MSPTRKTVPHALAAVALVTATAAGAAAPAAQATLTYASGWSTEGLAIFAARDDGSGPRALFKSKPDVFALPTSHVSPDGRLVAYERQMVPGGPPWLTVISARGGLSRFLAQYGTFLAWSPDSRTLAASVVLPGGRQQLQLIDTRTAEARVLADAPDLKGASFSPSGDRVVYAAGRGLASGLFVVPAAGGTSVTIDDGHRTQWPVWGRSWIACTRWRETARQPQLALVKPDGTDVREITDAYYPHIQPVDVSADGRRLLLEITKPTAWAATYDLKTGRLRSIGRAPRGPGQPGVVPYALSRDGRTVLGTTGTLSKPDRLSVVTMPFAGGGVRTLVRHAAAPSWSR